MEEVSLVTMGVLGSLAAGLMTAVGALPVLFTKTPNRGVRDLALGFAAGVMLAASFFSLIIPSLEASELRYGGSVVPAAIACAAILLGIGMVALLNELLPHEHFEQGREGPEAASLRRIWLFIIAITIHNLPEGLAVGVAFGAGKRRRRSTSDWHWTSECPRRTGRSSITARRGLFTLAVMDDCRPYGAC